MSYYYLVNIIHNYNTKNNVLYTVTSDDVKPVLMLLLSRKLLNVWTVVFEKEQ
jgi:hypothetical protein